MAEAKTVDNLGADVHQRYINDTRLLSEEEKTLFKTPDIAKRAEVLETALKYPHIELLWGLQEKETSFFIEPPGFVLTTDVFTYSLIPSLGPDSQIIEKLEAIKEEKDKEKDSDKERQRKSLLKFAKALSFLNTIISEISRKKEEFHKG